MSRAEVLGRLDARELARLMRETGTARIPSALSHGQLDEARRLARDSVRANGDAYTYLSGEALSGTLVDDIARSPEVSGLLSLLYKEAAGEAPAPDQSVQPVLRCLTGESGARHSLRFHFDSYVVTAVLPIEIPAGGGAGDLLYYPNRRPVRRSGAVNIGEKAIVQNAAVRRLLASRRGRSLLPPRRLRLIPGDLYLFWGYRTFHTNDRSDPQQLRATALFHFGDPHLHDPVVRLLRRIRS